MCLTLSQTLSRECFQPLVRQCDVHTGNQRQEPVPLGNVARDRMSDNRRAPKAEEVDRNPFQKQDFSTGYIRGQRQQ